MTIAVLSAPFDYPPGPRYTPLTAGKVYSLQQDGDDTFNFQTRGNDRYASPLYSDPPNVIRSEVYGPSFPAGKAVTFDYTLTVMPGPISTLAWLIFGQLHSGNDVLGASPPLSINVLPDGKGGEIAWVNLNHRSQKDAAFHYDRIGSFPFKRGVAYHIVKRFVDARGLPTGLARVTVNDAVIADYAGVTGYFGQIADSYVKLGIYGGGKGSNVNAAPDPVQIIASYLKPLWTPAAI